MKNVVIYTRTASIDRQKLDQQYRNCFYFAKQNNMRIVGYYADFNKSGTNFNREHFQYLLKTCKKEWDYVLVESFSRFTRNINFTEKDVKALIDNDVKIISVIDDAILDLKEMLKFGNHFKSFVKRRKK